jgi:hypothetical protein
MALTLNRKRVTIPRSSLYLIVAAVIFTVLYLVFLAYQEQHARHRLVALRQSDPDSYLDQVRMLEGFDRYILEFRTIKGFDQFRSNAPIFMIGRWTLRASPERLPVGTLPACSDPILFEYGRVKLPRDGIDLLADFRLDGANLVVRPRAGEPFSVKVVGFAAAIDHLELVPPGRDTVSYAYPCVR